MVNLELIFIHILKNNIYIYIMYQNKYLKYKYKYNTIKSLIGGNISLKCIIYKINHNLITFITQEFYLNIDVNETLPLIDIIKRYLEHNYFIIIPYHINWKCVFDTCTGLNHDNTANIEIEIIDYKKESQNIYQKIINFLFNLHISLSELNPNEVSDDYTKILNESRDELYELGPSYVTDVLSIIDEIIFYYLNYYYYFNNGDYLTNYERAKAIFGECNRKFIEDLRLRAIRF